jgi:hypothetical protein
VFPDYQEAGVPKKRSASNGDSALRVHKQQAVSIKREGSEKQKRFQMPR